MAVTLVTGPPAAGKSTWVRERAARGDLVVDLDEIAGGHDRTPAQTRAALAEAQRRESAAASHSGDAWVIRCAADPAKRAELAASVGATRTVVLATDAGTAKARAAATRRPASWPFLIDAWWAAYEPAAGDEVVQSPTWGEPEQLPTGGHPPPDMGGEAMPEEAASSEAAVTPEHPAVESPDTGDPPQDWKAEAEKWKALARKHETEASKAMERAKSNSNASKELDQLRKASMTEQEKAVAQAREDASRETALRYGGRVVDAEVKAAAAAHNLSEKQVAALLAGLDRGQFVGDDGEPDVKSITEWVADVAPPPPARPGFPDLGQGARGGQSDINDMNRLIRRGAGLG